MVADVIADCERRGVTTADAEEFRRWVSVQGIGLGMDLLSSQLQWWQWIVYAFVILLGGGALTLASCTG